MHFVPQNLKTLRKREGLTQQEFARLVGVKRSLIGAYEEGRAEPRIAFLQLVAGRFRLTLDDLIGQPLDAASAKTVDIRGQHLRILPIAIDRDTNNERSTLVPVKAAAGYLRGYGDVEFIESLDTFELPFPELPRDRTYRIFQIEGESMLPVAPGSYVICSFVQDWNAIRSDQTYVILSREEGIVFKRVLNNIPDGYLILKSDNPDFENYELPLEQVIEVWKAHGVVSFEDLAARSPSSDLAREVRDIKQQLNDLVETMKRSG